MDFERYNARRRRYEIGFWIVLMLINVVANSMVENLEIARGDSGTERWEPWAWETTSGLLWLALIPVLLWFDSHFRIERPNSRRHLLFHLAFTLPFSMLHVLGMVGLREIAYWWVGWNYNFGHWPSEFLYEYLKDARTYFTLLLPIYLYRFVLLRWQGEASLPDSAETDSAPADRFLVKKLGKEFLVRTENIEWLEASGNYVNLHANGRVYPLRETMSTMERRLRDRGFLRVHRSAIVNMDRVAEIEPFDTGDAQARLDTGAIVPVSRRYRAELRERLG